MDGEKRYYVFLAGYLIGVFIGYVLGRGKPLQAEYLHDCCQQLQLIGLMIAVFSVFMLIFVSHIIAKYILG